jgi:hypothetical protein
MLFLLFRLLAEEEEEEEDDIVEDKGKEEVPLSISSSLRA